jgi:hypothetical protein
LKFRSAQAKSDLAQANFDLAQAKADFAPVKFDMRRAQGVETPRGASQMGIRRK